MSISWRIRAALFACLAFMSIAMLVPVVAGAGPAVAPETYIKQGPSSHDITTDRTPTFRFASNQNGSTFECSLDNGAYFACTSPYTTPVLSDGPHDFDVRATNNALTDMTPAHRHFFIDHDFVPDTLITNGPANGSTTADDTPTFTFIGASWHHYWGYPSDNHATTFACSIDGGAWFSCTSPYTTPSLTDGLHTFSVRATRDYRTDPSPATRTFTIDRGIPETTITGGPTEGSTIPDATPEFTFTSNRAGSTFMCSVDGVSFACVSPVTTSALTEGQHTFMVAATSNGNTDPTAASRTFLVDIPDNGIVPPPIVVVNLPQPQLPSSAGGPSTLGASKVSIASAAGTIGMTGATRFVVRCSAGASDCIGRLKLVKTIRYHCPTGFCFVRKTLANTAYTIPKGTQKAIKPQLTREAIRLVRSTTLDRLLVLAIATNGSAQTQKAVTLIGQAPV